MSQPKCPQCGGLTGHWNELCEKCGEAYWEDQNKNKEKKMTIERIEMVRAVLIALQGGADLLSEDEMWEAKETWLLSVCSQERLEELYECAVSEDD